MGAISMVLGCNKSVLRYDLDGASGSVISPVLGCDKIGAIGVVQSSETDAI